ncbi:Protein CLC-2 [Aphelenchoides avenae]|nr:Protein CLC-2 [Aphelenchus avenae]
MPLPSIHGLQIASLALGIVGFVAGFVALLTPAWQVVYARELQQWIQSGLWLNCQTRPSVLLHSIGLVTFSVFSQMVEYRFYHVSVSGIYEKHRGYSFYVELLATLMLAGSLILAIAYVLGIPYDGLDPYECQFAMRDLPPPPGRGR